MSGGWPLLQGRVFEYFLLLTHAFRHACVTFFISYFGWMLIFVVCWKILSLRILVVTCLQFGLKCMWCNEVSENSSCHNVLTLNKHLFMQCNVAKAFWFTSPLWIHIPCNAANSWLLQGLTTTEALPCGNFGNKYLCLWEYNLWTGESSIFSCLICGWI